MMKFRNFFMLTTASLLLVNCAAENSANKPTASLENKASTSEATAKAENRLDFYDSEVFDGKLGAALMGDQPTVEVVIISPFSANEIPKRMSAWISTVNEHGGTVKMQPDPAYPQTKGIIGEIADLIGLAYDASKMAVIYGAAEKYNLVMFFKPDGMVTKVVFKHK